jgi:hypothetical protein
VADARILDQVDASKPPPSAAGGKGRTTGTARNRYRPEGFPLRAAVIRSGVYSMSAVRGKQTRRRVQGAGGGEGGPTDAAGREDAPGLVPELLRRVVGMGFSGFFLTEEVVRKALGETLPKDWVDFAAAQSERTRRELIDRVTNEVRRTLDGVDLPQLAERLLRGHSIEISGRVRFVPHGDEPGAEEAQPAPDPAPDPARRHALRITVTETPDGGEEDR